jgi:hypothetical protein
MKQLTRWQRLLPASAGLAYFPAKSIHVDQKWELLRKLGKDLLTPKAQERLEWMIFYNTVANRRATDTARYFGITRKTLHKYLSRFDEKNVRTLEEKSRRPEKTRGWMVTVDEERKIIALRKKNMEYGKKKLQVLYKREYGNSLSTWKIERVVRKHKQIPPDLVVKSQTIDITEVI